MKYPGIRYYPNFSKIECFVEFIILSSDYTTNGSFRYNCISRYPLGKEYIRVFLTDKKEYRDGDIVLLRLYLVSWKDILDSVDYVYYPFIVTKVNNQTFREKYRTTEAII